MSGFTNSRYIQAIPGVNRTDDAISFTHGEKCISHFGDGLPQPQKVTAEAAIVQGQGRNKRIWCEALNKTAESGIREAFRRRENKLRQWKEHLNKEVDKLAKEIVNVAENQRDVQKQKQYFGNLMRTSQNTTEYRRKIEDDAMFDRVGNAIKEEQNSLQKAIDDMDKCTRDLKDCERKMQNARNALMSEVEAKSLTMNLGKRCQHAEPLLNFPYMAADHPVDQIYHPNKEEDWEKILADKLQNAVSVRQEAPHLCGRTADTIKRDKSDTADKWYRASKALQEIVQEDERTVFNIKNLLGGITEDTISTEQRIASFYDDLKIQDRVKDHQFWRLQTMTYRPGPDHIRDAPIRKLDEEVGNIEKKSSSILENIKHNKELLQNLNDEKRRQTLLLEKLSKKLFIEREHCLGLRRTVPIEGLNLNDYVSF
ncbi:tektin-5-like [Uloborus diversus]|uniref:tektin-5-like n=1 Tax=Uloborus diversus TaxID=327109 RepID=UPI0024094728|nr:tektin-5-like [Uloborus diversus]